MRGYYHVWYKELPNGSPQVYSLRSEALAQPPVGGEPVEMWMYMPDKADAVQAWNDLLGLIVLYLSEYPPRNRDR